MGILDSLSNSAPSQQSPDAPTAPTSNPTQAQQGMEGLMRPPQQPQQRPPMSHEMTVAAITHFQAVTKQLKQIAANPGLGRENIRPKIFNAIASLLGDGFFTLPMVMNEIKTLPTDPVGQKQWVMTHLMNAQMAQKQVIQDHRDSQQGTGDYQSEAQNFTPSTRVHADMMSELSRNYKGA